MCFFKVHENKSINWRNCLIYNSNLFISVWGGDNGRPHLTPKKRLCLHFTTMFNNFEQLKCLDVSVQYSVFFNQKYYKHFKHLKNLSLNCLNKILNTDITFFINDDNKCFLNKPACVY